MKTLLSVAASLLLLGAMDARASIELTSFNVASHNSGAGLLVSTSPSFGGPKTLSLSNAGDTAVVDLFNIWTNETSVNIGEDTSAKSIGVSFNFKFNSEAFGAVAQGQTLGIAGVFIIIPFGAGVVDWSTPVDVVFGQGGAGKLRIELIDQVFNAGLGFGNLTPGQAHGASVKAKFTLVSNLPPGSGEPGINAPEPSTLAVWAGLGVATIVVAAGRRRTSKGYARVG